MIRPIKKRLRRTAFGQWLIRQRDLRRTRGWSVDDQRRLEFYGCFVKPGDLCFDVGANIGNRTKVFLRLGARVIAVEPQPFCADWIRRELGNNPKLTVVPSAIGPERGQAEMMISFNTEHATLSKAWIDASTKAGRFEKSHWKGTRTVEVTTLDQLIAAHGLPVMCKIDVEGFELEAVKGLSQPLPLVSLEYHPEFIERTIQCLQQLAVLGPIEVNYSQGESMTLAWENWHSMDETIIELRSHTHRGDVYIRSVNHRAVVEGV